MFKYRKRNIMTCTFFGHHDAPSSILRDLNAAIEDAVTDLGVDHFLVGNQGNFDQLARLLLNTFVKDKHPDIRYEVVLAYLPGTDPRHEPSASSITIYPEGLENVPPRFAVSRRNKWMVDHSDVASFMGRCRKSSGICEGKRKNYAEYLLAGKLDKRPPL